MRDGNSAPFSREDLGQSAESVCHWHERGLDVERVGVAVRVLPIGDGGDVVRGRRGDEFIVDARVAIEGDQLGLAFTDE